MIQRIQSIWLLLASACAFLTLRLSFFSGNKIVDGQKQFVLLNAATGSMLLLVLSVVVGIAALILIFLYKDRKMQLRITLLTLLISIVNIILYFSEIKKFVPHEGNYDISALLSFLIPIFLILATRGIYKDEKLVRSVDRLR